MIDGLRDRFSQVKAVDFEFGVEPGERPVPRCLVARDVCTGETIRVWADELVRMREAPFSTQPDTLFVAYYASAELGCFDVLGWRMPDRVLDLYAEFRCMTNGLDIEGGAGLLGAALYFGLDAVEASEKEEMRNLALRGGDYTLPERRALLDYCESDVDLLEKLLVRMLPKLDIPRALLRGRYMKAAALIEGRGIPLDAKLLSRLRAGWQGVQDSLVGRIDQEFGVYEGRTFKVGRFEQLLVKRGIAWPRLPSGALALDDDTFREMSRAYPALNPLRELRVTMSRLRLSDLAVGMDGRNRCLLSAYRSKTGRNQPSNSKFIFGPAVWLRGLIRAEAGRGLAYIDWEQQEFGIAAALSGDERMQEAYRSGDPYLSFAKLAGAVPTDATKHSHREIRDLFKACALAVQYGMGADSLAARIGQSPAHARELLRLHRATFPVFWTWSDAAADYAALRGSIHTVFGWPLRVTQRVNSRSLRNFPMQANGAEMLRLACAFATENRAAVCAPVHDALLIEAPLGQLEMEVERVQSYMVRASREVLGGFELRSDFKLVRYPDRYEDARGKGMWDTIMGVLRGLP